VVLTYPPKEKKMNAKVLHRMISGVVLACCWMSLVWLPPCHAGDTWETPVFNGFDGAIVFRTVLVEDEDEEPAAAGITAAKQLKAAFGKVPLKAVIVSECFEDLDYKEELLGGICSELPAEMVFGSATYGSFTQSGCTDFDSVCLMGIGGEAISIAAALEKELGVSKLTFEENEPLIQQRLTTAGARLTGKLRRTDKDRLMILLADAHSPKNQYLVEGVQKVLGTDFPVTGGSANKNAGQTYVYFQGKAHADSAIGLMLSGDFRVALSGRKAMDNDQVIATAKDGADQALKDFAAEPVAVLAFNCAGRRGKLRRPADELSAIQQALGKQVPLFGCYCAGEVGPLDASEKKEDVLCGGSGWHVMFTVLGR
jgi:hypothetical protein